MGCGSSRVDSIVTVSAKERADLLRTNRDLRVALLLSEEDVVDLYLLFKEANVNEDEFLTVQEMIDFFEVEKSRFAHRVFSMFQGASDEGLTVPEFIFGLWNLCTSDRDALTLFAFQMYDGHNNGVLDTEDVMNMLEELFGEDFKENPFAHELMKEMLFTDYKGDFVSVGVQLEEFIQIAERRKNLLYRPFQLQFQLQDKVLGVPFWNAKTQERIASPKFDIRQVLETVNRNKPRAKSFVAMKGLYIVPYASANAKSESSAERASRELRLRLTKSFVGRPVPDGLLLDDFSASISPGGAAGPASAASPSPTRDRGAATGGGADGGAASEAGAAGALVPVPAAPSAGLEPVGRRGPGHSEEGKQGSAGFPRAPRSGSRPGTPSGPSSPSRRGLGTTPLTPKEPDSALSRARSFFSLASVTALVGGAKVTPEASATPPAGTDSAAGAVDERPLEPSHATAAVATTGIAGASSPARHTRRGHPSFPPSPERASPPRTRASALRASATEGTLSPTAGLAPRRLAPLASPERDSRSRGDSGTDSDDGHVAPFRDSDVAEPARASRDDGAGKKSVSWAEGDGTQSSEGERSEGEHSEGEAGTPSRSAAALAAAPPEGRVPPRRHHKKPSEGVTEQERREKRKVRILRDVARRNR